MTDFGPGVNRTLETSQRAFCNVIFQNKKPPLSAELNLVGQVANEKLRQFIHSQLHSGIFLDPTNSRQDFLTNYLNSNQFFLGPQKEDDEGVPEEKDPVVWAVVNGWIVPVVGTDVAEEDSTTNRVRFNPPPETGSRIDLVFLEVWQAQVAHNPSTANKPSQSEIWKFGNVLYGGTNLPDDLEDPTIGFETTERVQIQYRLRVYGGGSTELSVSLDKYPDGLDDPNITAQGPLDVPSVDMIARFINMRKELGDPSLWRAGDGDEENDLRTVDGYIYAIPIAAVFRRNSTPFVAANLAGNPNQNGAFNRLPSSNILTNPRDGATQLSQATLTNALPVSDNTLDVVVEVDGLANSGIDDSSHNLENLFLVIEDEVVGVSDVDTTSIPATITIPAEGRGRTGSDISNHAAGTNLTIFNTRPDFVYSDQIEDCDVLDLRRGVNPGDWDYERLLYHNIGQIARGTLHSSWKQSGVPGGDTQGPCVIEVDTMLQDGNTAVPNGTEAVDGLDGIRTTFSDAAIAQADVTVMCNNLPVLNEGFVSSFDDLITWTVGADFKPSGFMNNQNGALPGFRDGSTIFLNIGGDTGNVGARKTFRDGSLRAVRFVAPQEHWKTDFPTEDTGRQHPVTLRWVGPGLESLSPALSADSFDAVEHPGPMYPLKAHKFTKPYIVLGGILHESFQIQNLNAETHLQSTDPDNNIGEVILPGFDFDEFGEFAMLIDDEFQNRPECLEKPLLRGQRTLFGMLTNEGTDRTGASSQVYLILYGDDTNLQNNGAFRVLGAGTIGYTSRNATTKDALVVEFLTGCQNATGTVTIGDIDEIDIFIDGITLIAGNSNDPANDTYDSDVLGSIESQIDNMVFVINSPSSSFSTIVVASKLNSNTLLLTAVVVGEAGNLITLDTQTPLNYIPSGPNLTGGGGTFTSDPGEFLTAEIRSQFTNSEDGAGSDTGPAALSITLTDLESCTTQDSPWAPSNLGNRALTQPFNSKMIINSTLMYHPGRGGTARVPDKIMRTAVSNPSGDYLRQSGALLDTDFSSESGAPGDPPEIHFDDVHVQTWNRLSTLGLSAPDAPNSGGNIVASSEQDREHELFVDRGSKTIIFRPFQRKLMTIQAVTILEDLLNPSSYPNPALRPDAPIAGTIKDGAQIFTTGLKMGYAVPPEFMPKFGRQDIPYFQDNGPVFGSFQHLEGINHLFTDSTDVSSPVFFAIGGEDNQGPGNLVTSFYIQTGTSSGFNYAMHGTITGPGFPAYQGRLTKDIGFATPFAADITNKLNSVISSDLGRSLKGIQMPPYIGLARVYGVYDRRDFVDVAGGITYDSDRVTPLSGRAVNLLLRDATQQTLFILQDGAKDITGNDGDHTYIIPSNAIDITRSPAFIEGESFDDLEYVVECSIFGFASHFINGNNYVVCRRHTATADLIADGDDPEVVDIPMTIPAPGPDSDRVYVEYQRTVYQGDPYMTRDGSNRVVSDYEHRYGQISVTNMLELKTSIQQFDQDGTTIPQIPNKRTLEVLASVDFYTTLGTGKMGGILYPGTLLDVGYTENTPPASKRKPPKVDSPNFRIFTRAFTESQNEFNKIRARAVIRVITSYASFLSESLRITPPNANHISFFPINGVTTLVDKFNVSSADPVVIANELAAKINAHPSLLNVCVAIHDLDSPRIELLAIPVGAEGNGIFVETRDPDNLDLLCAQTGEFSPLDVITGCFMTGGLDININAGDGTSQLRLTGMTERLPLGILLQDSDFFSENPLNDNASAMQTQPAGLRPVQTILPLTRDGGEEFSRFLGDAGEFLGQADGSILQYQAFTDATLGGTKKFRIFRGGGSAYVLTDPEPGGPIDWVSGTLDKASNPILKGGLLACKALLVRNFVEEAFAEDDTTTEGDEIQMVILTFGILGDGNTIVDGINLSGVISPTGYGEGYAAADRYRLDGKPMVRGRVRVAPEIDKNDLALFTAPEPEPVEPCPEAP